MGKNLTTKSDENIAKPANHQAKKPATINKGTSGKGEAVRFLSSDKSSGEILAPYMKNIHFLEIIEIHKSSGWEISRARTPSG